MIPSPDKITLTKEQQKQVELVFTKFKNGSISLEEVILELRCGDNSGNYLLFFIFLYLLQHYGSEGFEVPPFLDPFSWLSKSTPSLRPQCPSRYPFERMHLERRHMTAAKTEYGDRFLQPHVIDKTIFKNDKELVKEYNKLIKSNSRLKKDFERLEKSISQGNFQGGREKGLQKWKGSKNIYYMGTKKSGARIYFKFTGKSGEHKVSILGYANKPRQTSIANHIVIHYDN